jgi:exosortase
MTSPSDEGAGRAAVAARGPSPPVPVAMPARVGPIFAVRDAAFLVLVGLSVAWLWPPLSTVIVVSLRYSQYEHYSHVVLIPLISAVLVYLDRGAIFARVAYAPGWGGVLMLAGVALSWIARSGPVTDPEQIFVSLAMLGLVLLCAGAFLLCYGMDALKAAAFPVAFLLFMVPLPPFLLHSTIVSLQKASTEVTYVLFKVVGVPVYREGFFFWLPGLAIEVAEECSGIRSFLALTITGVLAGHLLLRTGWARGTLALAMLPIAIVKNAVRIVVLSLLAIHVDKSFITGSVVHSRGGIPLFFVTLLVVGGVVWLLQRAEAGWAGRAGRVKVGRIRG